jgi:hypothetical protein
MYDNNAEIMATIEIYKISSSIYTVDLSGDPKSLNHCHSLPSYDWKRNAFSVERSNGHCDALLPVEEKDNLMKFAFINKLFRKHCIL